MAPSGKGSLSEGRFEAIFEQSPFSAQIFSGDGTTLRVNAAWRKLWAVSEEEVRTQIIDKYNILKDGSVEALGILPHFRRAFLGEAVATPAFRYDPAKIGKPGRERWVVCHFHPIHDDDGVIREVVLVHEDLTEEKLVKDRLRESELRFRQLAESIHEVFWLNDPVANKVLYVSPAFEDVWGMSRQELYDRPTAFMDRVLDEDRPLLQEFLAKQREGRVGEVEYRIRREDGSVRWIWDRAYPLKDPTGQVYRVAGVAEDVSRQKSMLEELQGALRRQEKSLEELARSNRELEQFAYVASHDLKEPLRMVSSYVQLLEKQFRNKLSPDADEYIGYAVRGAHRMHEMINDLLAYGRLGRDTEGFHDVDAKQLLTEVLETFEDRIRESGAKVLQFPLPVVRGNPSQLRQVFQNLIGNALKFRRTERPPEIRISAVDRANFWQFEVADNGIGIETAYLTRIFIIFQRLHSKDAYPGTGIGLAICKKIIERHGGEIWAESRETQGASFFFTLPKRD